LCHFVLSCFWGEKAKRCHAKTRQIVTFSCFRMATFRPATQKYATFHALRFRLLFLASLPYGGCFVPCRINVFSGRKREKSPRENPLNSDFGGISHGDLSPRQAKIRQTVAENATRGMSRTFVWRGERSPCENTKKVNIWRVFAWRPFAPPCKDATNSGENAKGRHAKTRQMVIVIVYENNMFKENK